MEPTPLLIQGIEWIIIIGLIVVLLIWGPDKIPKLARSLGQAKREFEKASKEAEATVQELVNSTADPILDLAKELGIDTKGKTKEEIMKEIKRLTTSTKK
jgi:sec-independent protein translocase protein TatA